MWMQSISKQAEEGAMLIAAGIFAATTFVVGHILSREL
jgi:hypothetical protein